jgi:acylphosphatase
MSGHGTDAAGGPGRARLHATVRGKVQRVHYRDFVARHAQQLGLAGSVRNLLDGRTVRVEAEGERAALEALLERLRRGPFLARVDAVETTWLPPRGDVPPFRVEA